MTISSEARQLIVCCDGTNNNLTGGRADTNVVKFLRWVGVAGSNQVVFYDPGVGNPDTLPGATPWDQVVRVSRRLAGLALGRGVYENIAEAYEFLMQQYRPGDEIYIFGFSRGAFTARSIGGMVNMFGILRPQMRSMVPTLLHVYFSDRAGDRARTTEDVANQIKDNFCDDAGRVAAVHFVGVWDTVASVGMPPFAARMTSKPTIRGKRFVHVRQALALDEHRVPFKPRLYDDRPGEIGPGQTLKQEWFRGAHCDVGGGYPPDRSAISNETLAWMLVEAHECGLRLDSSKVPLKVRAALVEALDPGLIGRPPIVHSEVYLNCLWAVAGLTVRSTTTLEIEGQPDIHVIPKEHESVRETPLAFPENSAWACPRPTREKLELGLLAALTIILYLGIGSLLAPAADPSVRGWISGVPQYVLANFQFVAWQLAGCWHEMAIDDALRHFHSPRSAALVGLFFLVPCCATILAWFVARAFAQLAGFNRAAAKPNRFVMLLGRALPALVIADVAEDLLTLSLVTVSIWADSYSMCAIAIFVSLASIAKFIAGTGVLILVAWGSGARARKEG